ncbi:hypothetical protein R3P38DRAFT_543023 [Favolaschia claudopus]|uniref:Secreted protein n=1 Tax=Favolaschia claudopus TaxID=2862362 RepID=A0AAW0CJT9_9AGAR
MLLSSARFAATFLAYVFHLLRSINLLVFTLSKCPDATTEVAFQEQPKRRAYINYLLVYALELTRSRQWPKSCHCGTTYSVRRNISNASTSQI